MSERRFQTYYLLALTFMILVISYGVFSYEPTQLTTENQTVTGLVAFREDNLVWVLLTSDDHVNKLKAGALY